MTLQKIVFFAVVALVVLMSVVTFFTFAADKRRAVKGKERVKEKTLLGMTAFFGSLGALLGRLAAHHKTDKVYFSIVIWVSLVLHAALTVFTCYLAFIR